MTFLQNAHLFVVFLKNLTRICVPCRNFTLKDATLPRVALRDQYRHVVMVSTIEYEGRWGFCVLWPPQRILNPQLVQHPANLDPANDIGPLQVLASFMQASWGLSMGSTLAVTREVVRIGTGRRAPAIRPEKNYFNSLQFSPACLFCLRNLAKKEDSFVAGALRKTRILKPLSYIRFLQAFVRSKTFPSWAERTRSNVDILPKVRLHLYQDQFSDNFSQYLDLADVTSTVINPMIQ